MNKPRASYGQQNGSFSTDVAGGPPDALCYYCNQYVKINGGKVWRWADNETWCRSTIEIATIEAHLITKKPKDSKRS